MRFKKPTRKHEKGDGKDGLPKVSPMLESLSIPAFRGLGDVNFPDLGDVTLFFGGNNSGKTSVLEAIALLARPLDPAQWAQVSRHRDIDLAIPDGLWAMFPASPTLSVIDGPKQTGRMRVQGVFGQVPRDMAFSGLATENWESDTPGDLTLRIEGKVSEQRSNGPFEVKHSMVFRRDEAAQFGEGIAFFRCYTITPMTHRSTRQMIANLSRVIDEGRKNSVVEALQIFDPKVLDLDISSPGNRQGIRVSHREREVAELTSFGDGMRRVAALAVAIELAKGGLVLVDELETGIHIEILAKVFDWLLQIAAENQVQLVATTHSLETIDALSLAAQRRASSMVGYWLKQREKDNVMRFGLDKILRLRDTGLDLR